MTKTSLNSTILGKYAIISIIILKYKIKVRIKGAIVIIGKRMGVDND